MAGTVLARKQAELFEEAVVLVRWTGLKLIARLRHVSSGSMGRGPG
jgi:hypothetical protein